MPIWAVEGRDDIGYVAECNTGVSVEDADELEVRRTVDNLARRYLGMTGDDFLALRAAGRADELGDSPATLRVLSAASLLD